MGVLLIYCCLLVSGVGWCSAFTSIDQTKYEIGKRQLELVEKNSQMPQYGRCWKNAIVEIQVGCRRLTDVVQSRLALAYLNCFLNLQGRETYQCEPNESIESCTKFLSDVDRNSFTTFFAHTQNICYFLQAQVWQEGTEKTISDLSSQSKTVVSELHEAGKLQQEITSKQNEVLENQEQMLEQAANLSNIITSSADDIQGMFAEFKTSTEEQRLLITDIFDRVTKLHATVVDEFSGFYTMVYYTLAIIICYILTSTNRTAAARIWLFALMTINMIIERFFLDALRDLISPYVPIADDTDKAAMLYVSCWLCRKVSAGLGLVILLVFACRYRDLNAINNQLLLEIRKQNSDLKHFLQGKVTQQKPSSIYSPESPTKQTVETSQADSTGYETDPMLSDSDTDVSMGTGSHSNYTDHTYKPADDTESNKTETSFSTALTGGSASTKVSKASSRTRSLQRELRDLKNSTPFKELTEPLVNWAKTGYYRNALSARHLDGDSDDSEFSDTERRLTRSRSGSPSPHLSTRPVPGPSHSLSTEPTVFRSPANVTSPETMGIPYPPQNRAYALRARHTARQNNTLDRSESPRTFGRTVKRLEKLAIKNSRLVKRSILREERIPQTSEEER